LKKRGRLAKLREELAFVRRNLLVLMLSWVIWSPFSHATTVYEQMYIMALGASVLVLGLMAAASSIALGLARFLGGYLADRYGRKRVLVSMTFVYSSALFLYALAPDWRWILMAAIITNICLLYQPALSAILSDSVPPERRGFGFALASFLPELVSLPAPLLAIYLVSTYGLVLGMRIAYALQAAAGLAAATIRLALKETLRTEVREAPSLRDFLSEYRGALGFASKRLGKFMLISISLNLAMGFTRVAQPFAMSYLGLSLDAWGWLNLLGGIAWLATVLPMGYLVDRLGRRSSLALGLSTTAIAFLLLTLAKDMALTGFWHLACIFLILWMGMYLMHNASSALEADLVPRPLRGRLSAVLSLVADLAIAASSAACGFLYEKAGPASVAAFCALASLAGLLATGTFREPGRRHE